VRITSAGPKTIKVGGRPEALVAVPGGVEAIVDGKLARFTSDGRRIGPTRPTPAVVLAADRRHGIVFTADRDGNVERLDTGARASIKQGVSAMAYGEGWLWLGRPDGMIERRHRDLSGAGAFNDGPHITAIAFDGGVWASQTDGSLTRFDPRRKTFGQNAAIPVAPGHALAAIAAVDAQPPTPLVWTISPTTKTLYEVSYNRLKVIASLRLPGTPVALAAISPTSVWVATSNNQLIKVTSVRK
jgi:hypothetical protein